MKDYIYIKLYTKKDRVDNKLLVIGLLRKHFSFKLFKYIYLTKVGQ